MGLNMEEMKEEMKEIIKEFGDEYFFKEPYSNYINGLGITTLGIALRNSEEEFDIRASETLDDLCLHVMLRGELPDDLDFPEEYMGVRVFYELFGEIYLRRRKC